MMILGRWSPSLENRPSNPGDTDDERRKSDRRDPVFGVVSKGEADSEDHAETQPDRKQSSTPRADLLLADTRTARQPDEDGKRCYKNRRCDVHRSKTPSRLAYARDARRDAHPEQQHRPTLVIAEPRGQNTTAYKAQPKQYAP